ATQRGSHSSTSRGGRGWRGTAPGDTLSRDRRGLSIGPRDRSAALRWRAEATVPGSSPPPPPPAPIGGTQQSGRVAEPGRRLYSFLLGGRPLSWARTSKRTAKSYLARPRPLAAVSNSWVRATDGSVT